MAMLGLVSAYPVSSGPPLGGQLSAGLSPDAEQNPAALEAAVKHPSSVRTQSHTDVDQVRIPAAEENAAKERRKGRRKQKETGLTSLLSPDADDTSPSSPLPAASTDRRQRRRQGEKAKAGRGRKNTRRHRKKRKGKKRNNIKRLGKSRRGGKHRQKSKVNCNDRQGQQNDVDSSPSQPDKSAQEGMQVVVSSSNTQPTSSLKQQKNSRKLYDNGENTRRRGSQESRKEQSRWAQILKETYQNATDIERRNSGRSEQLDTESDTPEVVATLGIRFDASVSVSARLNLGEMYATASDIVPPDQPRSSRPFHPLDLNQLYQQRVDIAHQNSAESAGSQGSLASPPGSPAYRDKRSAAIDLRNHRRLGSAVDIERQPRPTRGRSMSLLQLLQDATDLIG